jgi:hypothetical protein
MLEHFFVAMAAHTAVDITKSGLSAAARYLQQKRPDLEAAAVEAVQSGNSAKAEKVFQEATGVLIAEADRGAIQIDGAILASLRGMKFDHQNGEIKIGNSSLSSKVLVTGGSAGSTGQTTIGENTTLRSRGTAIELGKGASIVMTGGAKIVQN